LTYLINIFKTYGNISFEASSNVENILDIYFLKFASNYIPLSWLTAIGFPDPHQSIVFVRLYRVANFALGVSYTLGCIDFVGGKNVDNIVTVGAISNRLACILLMIFGIPGVWNDWGVLAKIFMSISAASTGLIAIELIVFNPCGT
jgi:hypothetical protein